MTELTALAARNAKPRDAMYRLAAGKGLHLQVMPNGAKYWRLKYRHLKKQPKMISLGVFPQVGLAEARAERDRLRQLIDAGIDPSTQRRADRLARQLATENSLEAIARAWFAEKRSSWVESYARGVISRLENNVFPWLGALPITEVTAPQILTTMQRIHERGACTDFCVNGIALKLRDAAFELDGKAVERRLPIMDWKRPFFTDVAQP